MTKNITRVVVIPLSKNDSPIIKKSFNKEQYKNEIELSKKVWNLKSTNNNAEIAWKIVWRCAPVNCAILTCNLCLNGKLEIATHQGINLLNKLQGGHSKLEILYILETYLKIYSYLKKYLNSSIIFLILENDFTLCFVQYRKMIYQMFSIIFFYFTYQLS